MYLIGLTGNIASGKSTVRHMLEELGARAIDADRLAHYVMRPGKPAWRAIAAEFGPAVLRADGSVDRRALGALVFADPARLARLEKIVHPAVSTELGLILRRTKEPIVVVEAVKLIEAGLNRFCDAVWIVTAPEAEARRRLMQERGLSAKEADSRLATQPALEPKLKLATLVVDNGGTVQATRDQVARAFQEIKPRPGDRDALVRALLGLSVPARPASPPADKRAAPGSGKTQPSTHKPSQIPVELTEPVKVRRAKPADSDMLGRILSKAEHAAAPLPRAEMLKRFGRWGYWVAEADSRVVALAAWRAENLVAVIRDLWVQAPELGTPALAPLLAAIEEQAQALSCEAGVIMTSAENDDAARAAVAAAGYDPRPLDTLHPLWRAVAEEELRPGENLYLKPLRDQMVTAPI